MCTLSERRWACTGVGSFSVRARFLQKGKVANTERTTGTGRVFSGKYFGRDERAFRKNGMFDFRSTLFFLPFLGGGETSAVQTIASPCIRTQRSFAMHDMVDLTYWMQCLLYIVLREVIRYRREMFRYRYIRIGFNVYVATRYRTGFGSIDVR